MSAPPGPPAARPGWQVRPATGADAAAVHRLTRAAFAAQAGLDPPPGALTETLATVAADLARDGGLVALDPGGRVVASLRWRADGPLRWVRRVGVDPGLHRRGVGRALLQAAQREATAAGATALRAGVRPELPGNLAFYASLGWVRVGEQPRRVVLGVPLPRWVPTPEEMRALGRRLAPLLRAGDVVVVSGPLGAGKTVFAQGVGAGLGVSGPVTSPTFVLARRHRGAQVDLVHADVYRLGGAAELDDLDMDSELSDAVLVVEWGEGVAERLADGHLTVRIAAPDAAPDAAPAPAPDAAAVPGPAPDAAAGLEPRWVLLRACGRAWADRLDLLDRL